MPKFNESEYPNYAHLQMEAHHCQQNLQQNLQNLQNQAQQPNWPNWNSSDSSDDGLSDGIQGILESLLDWLF